MSILDVFLVSSWIVVVVVAYPRTFLLPGQGLSNCRQGSHPTIGHLVYLFPWYSNYPVVGIYPNAVMGWFPIWWLYKSPLFTMFSLYVVKAPTSTPDRSPLISFCSSGLPLLGGKHFGSLHSSLWFLTLPCFVYSKSDVCRFFNPIASWFYEKKTPFLGPHNLDGQRKCGFRGVPYIPSSQVAECYAVYY